jgi:hypothetical protein
MAKAKNAFQRFSSISIHSINSDGLRHNYDTVAELEVIPRLGVSEITQTMLPQTR